MSYSRRNLVNQAKAWLGYNEYDGSHKQIIDVYNAHKPLARGYKVKYTDAWCATFVSACSVKCGYTEIIPTECGCPEMIKKLKALNAWVENDAYVPTPGDIMFYDWDDRGYGDTTGDPEHVGIVETVDGNVITVIEGNYSNSVKRRSITINGKYIRGYGVPKYDAEPVTPVKKDTLTVDGVWGKDTTRKSQEVLGTFVDGIVSNQAKSCKKYILSVDTSSWKFKSYGYKKGSELIKAIQRLVGAEIDGICGKDTITQMQRFLKKKGISVGEVDGYMGRNTVKGWQTYINGRL